jgi:hypothetical protein
MYIKLHYLYLISNRETSRLILIVMTSSGLTILSVLYITRWHSYFTNKQPLLFQIYGINKRWHDRQIFHGFNNEIKSNLFNGCYCQLHITIEDALVIIELCHFWHGLLLLFRTIIIVSPVRMYTGYYGLVVVPPPCP